MSVSVAFLFFFVMLLVAAVLEPVLEKHNIPSSVALVLIGYTGSELVTRILHLDIGIRSLICSGPGFCLPYRFYAPGKGMVEFRAPEKCIVIVPRRGQYLEPCHMQTKDRFLDLDQDSHSWQYSNVYLKGGFGLKDQRADLNKHTEES